ncbi:NUDIX hydrolase [Streptomyces sp. NBC_01185]|uniref:NUDIX hydrolase n=1 Tax=Streptomyces sp. NBC_01185 TaxID=2903764 RepID=UPI00386A9CA2|nr:NUDIX hydrolase [Streptomyces sp. NBC_01185]
MDTPRTLPSRPRSAAPRTHAALRCVRRVRDAVTLLPRGVAALALAVAGRGGPARVLLGAGPPAPRPGAVRVAAHAAATVLLGALSLVLAGLLLMAVARGPFYGFVDQGPYDHSWGGPGKAGAWLAHFAVSVPSSLAAIAALWGVAGLQHRLTAPLRGERMARWVPPAVLVCCAAGSLFVFAFLRQLP